MKQIILNFKSGSAQRYNWHFLFHLSSSIVFIFHGSGKCRRPLKTANLRNIQSIEKDGNYKVCLKLSQQALLSIISWKQCNWTWDQEEFHSRVIWHSILQINLRWKYFLIPPPPLFQCSNILSPESNSSECFLDRTIGLRTGVPRIPFVFKNNHDKRERGVGYGRGRGAEEHLDAILKFHWRAS